MLLTAVLVGATFGYETGNWDDMNIVYTKEDQGWVKHPGNYGNGLVRPGIIVDGVPKPGVYSSGNTPPPINCDNEWAKTEATITVEIAALRETRCPMTLKNLFGKANYSDRIFIGIIQQNAPDDVDCLQGYCDLMGTPVSNEQLLAGDAGDCKHFHQVRMHRMSHLEAKGPVFARSKQILTINDDDDFCMQIDAHTDVVPGWDVSMVGQWIDTGNEYAVLSTYPTNVDHIGINVNKHWEMPHLCKASFSGKGRIHNEQALAAANLEVPLLAPLWAAGLSFAKCHAERNVPTDPELKSTFTGEEYARGARLWTAGYDFYSITRPILGTYYGAQKGGKGGFKHNSDEHNRANERMATLLKWPESNQTKEAYDDLGIYGVGKKRTLEQYAEFSGVDTIKQQSHGRCVVQYIPWDWAHPMIVELKGTVHEHLHKAKKDLGANPGHVADEVKLPVIKQFNAEPEKPNEDDERAKEVKRIDAMLAKAKVRQQAGENEARARPKNLRPREKQEKEVPEDMRRARDNLARAVKEKHEQAEREADQARANARAQAREKKTGVGRHVEDEEFDEEDHQQQWSLTQIALVIAVFLIGSQTAKYFSKSKRAPTKVSVA